MGMKIADIDKVIVVEGKSDKKKVQEIIKEPIEIICTHGTIGVQKLDELMEQLDDKDVYILVDSDDSGEKLRKQLQREFPRAKHLYVDRMYREVATTPNHQLAKILFNAHFDVNTGFLS